MGLHEMMGEGLGELFAVAPAGGMLHGCVRTEPAGEGWVRPRRFAVEQLKAIGSCQAWHPGLFRHMAACTAGVNVEFETNSENVGLEIRIDDFPRGSQKVLDDVTRTGSHGPYDGVSCDVDGRHLPLALPPEDDDLVEFSLDCPDDAPEPGVRSLPGMGRTHRVRLWLPCLTSCAVGRVVGDGTFVRPVPARRHMLVIGDSIAQGFVAGDPGLSWPSVLAPHFDLDVMNQGIGGQVFQPGTLRGLASVVDPAMILVALGENYRYEACTSNVVRHDVTFALREVAQLWPDVPTWVMTPTWHSEETSPTHPRSCFAVVPGIIRTAVDSHEEMHLIEGPALLDAGPLLLADDADHPNKLGSLTIADRLAFVIDSLSQPAAERRARAVELLEKEPLAAFPLLEPARRGLGEVEFAQPGAVFLRLDTSNQIVWASDRKLGRRVINAFAVPEWVCALGEGVDKDARRLLGLKHSQSCHLAVYEKGEPIAIDDGFVMRVLGPEFRTAFLEHYSHPEYLDEGEVDGLLASGKVIGGFEDGRLCGFVAEHPEGAIGMLEVFPPYRRHGWARALESAKINQHLSLGYVPWCEVWPDNEASLSLQKSLGLTVMPADGMHYLSLDEVSTTV